MPSKHSSMPKSRHPHGDKGDNGAGKVFGDRWGIISPYFKTRATKNLSPQCEKVHPNYSLKAEMESF